MPPLFTLAAQHQVLLLPGRLPPGCFSLITLFAGPAEIGLQEGAPCPHCDQMDRDKNQVLS